MPTSVFKEERASTVLYHLAWHILVVGYPPTMKELGKPCRMGEGTVISYLKRLDVEGLVQRVSGARTRKYVGLTQKGWEVLEEMIKWKRL